MTRVAGRLGSAVRDRGFRRLILAYLGYGPFFAWAVYGFVFAIYILLTVLLSPSMHTLVSRSLVWFLSVLLLPVFYMAGAFPALATGCLTARRVKNSGSCPWYISAIYGAASSAAIIGVPVVILAIPKFIQSFNFAVWKDPVVIIAAQTVFGFLGTIPAWYLTQNHQRELADEHGPKMG
jgi:hypothetical protein